MRESARTYVADHRVFGTSVGHRAHVLPQTVRFDVYFALVQLERVGRGQVARVLGQNVHGEAIEFVHVFDRQKRAKGPEVSERAYALQGAPI